MNFDESPTLYDILDITPDASSQGIREAYIRIKSTYNRNNLALYTLVSLEERESTLKKIEEAYIILSSAEKRREYDQKFGFLNSQENPFDKEIENSFSQKEDLLEKVIPINRFPPMENLTEEENLLIPPTTHFVTPPVKVQNDQTFFSQPITPTLASSSYFQNNSSFSRLKDYTNRAHSMRSFRALIENRSRLPELPTSLVQAIEIETQWSGHFLKQIRDAYKISLEEMSGITKITKHYLIAIEEESFSRLPASVYVRGFLMQISRVLKLSSEKVTVAYLSRFNKKN